MNKTASLIREYVKTAQTAQRISNLLLGKPWMQPEGGVLGFGASKTLQNREMTQRLLGAIIGGVGGGVAGSGAGSALTRESDDLTQGLGTGAGGIGGALLGAMLGSRLAGAAAGAGAKIHKELGKALEGSALDTPLLRGATLSDPALAREAHSVTTLNSLLSALMLPVPPSAALNYVSGHVLSPIQQLAGRGGAALGAHIPR